MACNGGPTKRSLEITAGLLVVAGLGLIDHAAGPDLGLSLFYGVPVFLVARRAGLLPGLGLAIAAAIAWAVAGAPGSASQRQPWLQYWNALTRLGYFLMAVAAARMRSGLEIEAAHAREDALTGLANRRGFREAAAREIERARRYGRPLSLAYLDCDDFKAVNDVHGHDVGDHLLRSLAEGIREGVRALDVPARLGGDEFVLLLPETGAQEARDTLERLAGRLREGASARDPRVTVSIGAVTFLRPPPSVDAALRAADRLMYRAKQGGRARLEHHVEEGTEETPPDAD